MKIPDCPHCGPACHGHKFIVYDRREYPATVDRPELPRLDYPGAVARLRELGVSRHQAELMPIGLPVLGRNYGAPGGGGEMAIVVERTR